MFLGWVNTGGSRPFGGWGIKGAQMHLHTFINTNQMNTNISYAWFL